MSLTSLLKRAALFTGLSDSEAEEVASLCVEHTYPAGSVIIQQGDTGDELFVIQEGQVEILVMGSKTEQPVVVLGKGQIYLVFDGGRILVKNWDAAKGAGYQPLDLKPISVTQFSKLPQRLGRIDSARDFEKLLGAEHLEELLARQPFQPQRVKP